MSTRTMRLVAECAVLLAFCLRPQGLAAQVAGGTILGAVTDSSGASVSGAKVIVRNMATDVVRTVAANEEGRYSAGGNQISTAGKLDSTSTPSRQIQFGLKFTW